MKIGATMANPTQRNKIPGVHLNDETHAAMKKWAQYQGTTMPKLAQAILEEMHPVLEQMIEAYEDILAGKDKNKALNKLLAKGLALAAEQLTEGDEDVTDNGQSD